MVNPDLTEEQEIAIASIIMGDVDSWITARNSDSFLLLKAWADQGFFVSRDASESDLISFEVTNKGRQMLSLEYQDCVEKAVESEQRARQVLESISGRRRLN